jgi:hypothetical protein
MFRFVHDLQSRTVVKGEEIGAEIRLLVVVSVIRSCAEVFHEKCFCSLKVMNVHRDVFDFHVLPSSQFSMPPPLAGSHAAGGVPGGACPHRDGTGG